MQSVILLCKGEEGDSSTEQRYIVAVQYFSGPPTVEQAFKRACAARFSGCPARFLTLARVKLERPQKFCPVVQPRVHFLPLCAVVSPAVLYKLTQIPHALRRIRVDRDKFQVVFPQLRWWIPGVSLFSVSVEIFH